KWTCTLVALVKFLWAAISLPRSQVKERRSSCGSLRTCLPSAATKVAVSLLGTLRSITKRVWRSTSVAMWVLFAPERRSPSQWPGTARSSASAGRSRIEAASTICPSPLLVVPPLAWRICRVVRRCAAFILLVLAPWVYGLYYPQPFLNQILRKIPIAVVDNDLSELSRSFIQTLAASGA